MLIIPYTRFKILDTEIKINDKCYIRKERMNILY
jgi:hypothetical protein